MSDRIKLGGVRASILVGVHGWERAAPRDVLIDLDLEIDLGEACRTDHLRRTVDYDDLATRVRARAGAAGRRLIEAVAQDVADACLDDPRVTAVTVTVHKPGAVHDVTDVSVTIRRTRAS